MRPSSLGGGRILRHTLSVCPSVCPSVPLLSLPSVTSRHLANYNDTHVLFGRRRAAYRTAISAAQILVVSDTACAHVRGPRKCGMLCSLPRHRTKFGRSRSRCFGRVTVGKCPKNFVMMRADSLEAYCSITCYRVKFGHSGSSQSRSQG